MNVDTLTWIASQGILDTVGELPKCPPELVSAAHDARAQINSIGDGFDPDNPLESAADIIRQMNAFYATAVGFLAGQISGVGGNPPPEQWDFPNSLQSMNE